MLAHVAPARYAACGGAGSLVVGTVKSSTTQRSSLPWAEVIQQAVRQRLPVLFWRVPETGLVLLGLGEAARYTGSGPDAMTLAQRWIESYVLRVERGDDLPLCWFSSTFDQRQGRRDWSDWQGVKLVVPQVLLAQRQDTVRVIFHGQSEDDLRRAELLFDRINGNVGTHSPVSVCESIHRSWFESPEDFAHRVAHVTKLLGKDLLKVVLANGCHHLVKGSPLAGVIDTLTSSDRHGTHFVCSHGGASVFAGCTPEMLVQQDGLQWGAHVLAGTRSRSQVGARNDLLTSAKDRQEHDLVATGIAESLDAWVDTLDMPSEPQIRSLDHLYHLERHLCGEVLASTGFLDLVGALHPTPALGGYPQATAVDYLDAHEPLDRGGFGAPFGWISGVQHGRAAVAIRSALFHENRVSIFAGAGIVAQSDPHREQAEVAAKIAAIESELLGLNS